MREGGQEEHPRPGDVYVVVGTLVETFPSRIYWVMEVAKNRGEVKLLYRNYRNTLDNKWYITEDSVESFFDSNPDTRKSFWYGYVRVREHSAYPSPDAR